jgi:hypothetical protein
MNFIRSWFGNSYATNPLTMRVGGREVMELSDAMARGLPLRT